MNNSYHKTLDEDFISALNLYEKNLSHQEIINFLQVGNIVQKHICAIKLEHLNSQQEAGILVGNLTGQDGKIREAISQKLAEFIKNPQYYGYFSGSKYCDDFIKAITDINGNICRNIIFVVSKLKEDTLFCDNFCPKLVDLTKELLKTIESFDFQSGKYKVNKEVFKLYWCLETMFECADKIKFSDLKEIILKAKNIQDYTIREKVAKILSLGIVDEELSSAKNELSKDENYYVRRCLN